LRKRRERRFARTGTWAGAGRTPEGRLRRVAQTECVLSHGGRAPTNVPPAPHGVPGPFTDEYIRAPGGGHRHCAHIRVHAHIVVVIIVVVVVTTIFGDPVVASPPPRPPIPPISRVAPVTFSGFSGTFSQVVSQDIGRRRPRRRPREKARETVITTAVGVGVGINIGIIRSGIGGEGGRCQVVQAVVGRHYSPAGRGAATVGRPTVYSEVYRGTEATEHGGR
jgi:hypothetical protein